MDRYQIAKKEIVKGGWFRFPPTNNITQILHYIDYCREKGSFFLADNIAIAVLETALVKASKLINIPILVKDGKQARILSTVHSHKPIYSVEGYGEDGQYSRKVICYNCKPPLLIKSYITVYDKAL